MSLLISIGLLLVSYLFGSIPFGLLIVKAFTGRDIRAIASGRTGGTNAMRAAGLGAGILTGILDGAKAALTVWLAKYLGTPPLIHVLSPLAAIIGHNYSIFLAERDSEGRLHLRGGAGGAAAFGGAVGLWPPAFLIMLPIGLLIWYGLGYASITTLSIGLMTVIIFSVRAALGAAPWEYVLYGFLAEILLVWALRPNIQRLLEGTERRHGLPVTIRKWREKAGKRPKGEG